MKSLLPFLLLIPFLSFAQPEIPNGEFEEWELANSWNLTPVDWITQNGQLIVHTVPDSMPCGGDLAMRVKSLPGFEGGIPGISYTTVELDAIPPSLDFCVKCNIDGNADTVRVQIEFFNENIPEEPVYDEMWISLQNIDDWTEVSLELEQIEPVIDYAIITVQSGFIAPLFGGGWETWISVDNIAFGTGPNSINEELQSIVEIYPNPGSEIVQINSPIEVEQVNVHDTRGKLRDVKLSQGTLDASQLESGMYYLTIRLTNGDIEQVNWIKR